MLNLQIEISMTPLDLNLTILYVYVYVYCLTSIIEEPYKNTHYMYLQIIGGATNPY